MARTTSRDQTQTRIFSDAERTTMPGEAGRARMSGDTERDPTSDAGNGAPGSGDSGSARRAGDVEGAHVVSESRKFLYAMFEIAARDQRLRAGAFVMTICAFVFLVCFVTMTARLASGAILTLLDPFSVVTICAFALLAAAAIFLCWRSLEPPPVAIRQFLRSHRNLGSLERYIPIPDFAVSDVDSYRVRCKEIETKLEEVYRVLEPLCDAHLAKGRDLASDLGLSEDEYRSRWEDVIRAL